MPNRPIRIALFAAAAAVISLLAACSSDEPVTAVPASDIGTAVTTPTQTPQSEPTSAPIAQQPAIKTYTSSPPMTIDVAKSYTATFQMETGGEFTIELYPKEAPLAVNSFVFLARDGYYDGITFHRVIAGFMAQSGDPTGTGSGGPGYNFDNEPSPLRRHDTVGTVSMANAGVRNGLGTNGSQFFITFVPTTFLDGNEPDGTPKDCSIPGTSCHTVFGRVIEGMDVVNSISLRDPARATAPGDAIKTIIITEGESPSASKPIAEQPAITSVDYAQIAYDYAEAGDYQKAIANYDEAIRLDPKDDLNYSARGVLYAFLGQYERAIQDYDEAIRIDPQYAEDYNNRGVAYNHLGLSERAIQDFDEAIRLDPKDAIPYYNRGNAYLNLGQYERAIQDFDEAILLDPQYEDAYYNRGVAYAILGQYERAIQDFDEAIRLDPLDADTYYLRGLVYEELGKSTEAELDIAKAKELGHDP